MADEFVPSNPGELLIYQTADGVTRVQVRFEGDTVWLSQRDMADLFQTTPQNVTIHIGTIYEAGERANWSKRQLVRISYKFAPKGNVRSNGQSSTTIST